MESIAAILVFIAILKNTRSKAMMGIAVLFFLQTIGIYLTYFSPAALYESPWFSYTTPTALIKNGYIIDLMFMQLGIWAFTCACLFAATSE